MAKFKAVLDNPDLLRDTINTVSTLLNEGVFKVTKTGIELKSMDSANVSMVDMKLLASAFKEFDVDSETEMGLNISDLTSVLKRAKADDILTLELKESLLEIRLKGGTKRSFDIPLLDIKQEVKTPNLEFTANLKLKASVIEDGINDAEIISDAVTFEADEGTFTMRAVSENRRSELKLEKGGDALLEINTKGHVKSMFPIDYLKKMIKGSKLSPECMLYLGNDYPMKLEFRVIDKLQLSFILAPRIESE